MNWITAFLVGMGVLFLALLILGTAYQMGKQRGVAEGIAVTMQAAAVVFAQESNPDPETIFIEAQRRAADLQ